MLKLVIALILITLIRKTFAFEMDNQRDFDHLTSAIIEAIDKLYVKSFEEFDTHLSDVIKGVKKKSVIE